MAADEFWKKPVDMPGLRRQPRSLKIGPVNANYFQTFRGRTIVSAKCTNIFGSTARKGKHRAIKSKILPIVLVPFSLFRVC